MDMARTEPFEMVAIKVVTGAGAPWYTSGIHIWKGTSASLKPIPTSIMPRPMTIRGDMEEPDKKFAIPEKFIVPVEAYINAIPNNKKAVDREAMTRNLTPASTL